MSQPHVRIRVAGEQYALTIADVLEVDLLGDVTPVPGARSEILGVLNLRGQVVPVVDLSALLGLGAEVPPQQIVVIERGEQRAALAVDSVLDVGALPPAGEPVESPYLSAAVLLDGALVGIVDVDAVLAALTATAVVS